MSPDEPEDTSDLVPGIPSLIDDDEHTAPCVVTCTASPPRAHRIPIAESWAVGRGLDAGLRLDDAAVSRAHFSLSRDGDGVWITDLASQHGTSVEGERLRAPRRLRGGELIRAGQSTLYFHDGAAPLGPPFDALGGVAVWCADAGMRRLYEQLRSLARAPLSVVLLGETGTGKEVAARALHAWSDRAERPFVAINCAALPDTLVEAELFGVERGAYSGAHAARPGLFEMADGGTLFLDEVGELPPVAQAKLLRALETRRVQRIGDSGQERAVDVRVVSATNVASSGQLDARGFRRDLYYRLAGAGLTLPPLRQRPADLVLLARAFLSDAARHSGRSPPRLGSEALSALLEHRWPGNVRELKHLCEFLVASRDPAQTLRGKFIRQHLGRSAAPPPSAPSSIDAPPSFRPLQDEIHELESRRIAAALRAAGGNQTRAAALISMPRRTFLTKLRQYALN